MVAARSVAGMVEKVFFSDYPRGIVNCLWLCWFSALTSPR
jgi:hypothetical protein